MKTILLGDNLEEVEILRKYFLKYIAPKEGLLGCIKYSNGFDYRYKNGDLYLIRQLTLNSKGCKCDEVYYTNTIYKNDNLNEDKMYLIYSIGIYGGHITELKLEDIIE